MRPYSSTLDHVGTATEVVSMLAPAVLLAAPMEDWVPLGIMYVEAALLANGIKEIGKALIFRPRAYMYFDGYPESKVKDGDWRKSFPSGHTTMAFTGATYATYVFSEYFPDSPWKIPVIVGSYAFAVATGALRIASGNHFLTDVIVGAIIGSASGFLVPYFHTLGLSPNYNNKDSSRNAVSANSFSGVEKGLSLSILPNGVYGKYCF